MGNCSLPATNHWGYNTRWWSYRFLEIKRTNGLLWKYNALTHLFYCYAHYGFEAPTNKLNFKFNREAGYWNNALRNFRNYRRYIFDPFMDDYFAYTVQHKSRVLIMGHLWIFAYNSWTIICAHFVTEPAYWLNHETKKKYLHHRIMQKKLILFSPITRTSSQMYIF